MKELEAAIKKIEERCDHHRMARLQRSAESDPSKGSNIYRKVGCYDCHGHNKKCFKFTLNSLYKPIDDRDTFDYLKLT